MPTYTDGAGWSKGASGYPANAGETVMSKYEVVLDFAAIAAARLAAGLTALAIGDVLRIAPSPAGVTLVTGGLTVIKAEVGAPTAKLALAVGGTTVVAAAVLTPVGFTPVAAPALAGIAAAGFIDVTISVAVPLDAKVKLTAVVIDAS